MAKPPLLIHLIFHPDSAAGLGLAREIHRQLNDEIVVPGLRVPTTFCPLSEANRPPDAHRLELAEHSFAIPLADDELGADSDWCRFVGDVWEACQNGPHRCVPMQLSPNAWPLDKRLQGVNFGRAFAQPEGSERSTWVLRRVVTELCRFLLNRGVSDDASRAPVEVFLSHAKYDLDVEPKAAHRLIEYLKADQPVEAWVDSGAIETGFEFAKAITRGVARSSLLVVLTDNYSTREWCREEVMLAKELERPIAVIDALMNHEVRSFPFLENVPKLRWNGNPHEAVDLLLKETLRHLHTKSLLARSQQAGDLVFLRPPEPATLLGVAAGSEIIYPDPPLGIGELQRLSKSKATFSTPLERLAADHALERKLVALSMSESTDASRWGMDQLHLDQTMLELSRYLLIKGATLAYGGHLGNRGYTRQLFELVRMHNSREGAMPFERIVNHRGWPLPNLSVAMKAELSQVCTVVTVPRPPDIDERLHADFVREPQVLFPGDKSPEHRYAWSRGMTEMRAFQADRAQSGVLARIVLGGTFGPTLKVEEGKAPRETWYSSRMPGVLEEILLSIQAAQPVFLIGAFGGVAKLAIDLLLGRRHPAANWEYQSQAPFAGPMRDLYASHGQNWWYYDGESHVDNLSTDEARPITTFLADAWRTPRKGTDWETSLNPLTRAENQELFQTVDTGCMVELLLSGLKASSSVRLE